MNPRLLTYGSGSGRNDGTVVGAFVAGVAFVGVVWFCIPVVSGTRVVTGVGWVCAITGSVAFFCSDIFCCGVVDGACGAGEVHPATSITMQSALTTIKKIFCINPAERKRAIKVLFIFESEKKFP